MTEAESSAVVVQGTATVTYETSAASCFSVKASLSEFLLYSYWVGHPSTVVPLAKPFNTQVWSLERDRYVWFALLLG